MSNKTPKEPKDSSFQEGPKAREAELANKEILRHLKQEKILEFREYIAEVLQRLNLKADQIESIRKERDAIKQASDPVQLQAAQQRLIKLLEVFVKPASLTPKETSSSDKKTRSDLLKPAIASQTKVVPDDRQERIKELGYLEDLFKYLAERIRNLSHLDDERRKWIDSIDGSLRGIKNLEKDLKKHKAQLEDLNSKLPKLQESYSKAVDAGLSHHGEAPQFVEYNNARKQIKALKKLIQNVESGLQEANSKLLDHTDRLIFVFKLISEVPPEREITLKEEGQERHSPRDTAESPQPGAESPEPGAGEEASPSPEGSPRSPRNRGPG